MPLEFVTVDVFTNHRFGGNPLAVVLDGEDLTAAQMQRIAAEFNLSETSFVLPPREASHTAAVRIFTPKAELPFAGHPNVGTAFALGCRGSTYGRPVGEPLVFEEQAGLVPIDLLKDNGAIIGARLTAPRPLSRGADVSVDIIAAACSLAPGDIQTAHHQPCVASCGTAFVLAELKTRQALAAAQPRPNVFAEHLPIGGATGIHLYFRESGGDIDVRARMFAPSHGVPEDPATGSANASLAGLLASLLPEPDARLQLCIVQGIEMGRPSVLDASAEKHDGEVTQIRIGGRCVAVMSGKIDV